MLAQAFPHPLARLNVVADTTMTGLRNQLSYSVVNEMVFSGLGHMINKFRRDVLQLPALRLADHGASMLESNRVRRSAQPGGLAARNVGLLVLEAWGACSCRSRKISGDTGEHPHGE